jgi:type I restriction enzyme S subunit
MWSSWPTSTVWDLQQAGVLRVEDGNHGESRPRPNEFVSDGTAFIRASDMVNDTIDFSHAERINGVALARITKGIGRPYDILFSHKGTVGKLAIAPADAPPFVCSPQTTFWRTTDEARLDRRFLFAFMCSLLFKNQWRSRKGETDMADYVSLTAQRALEIPMPHIDEQRAIAASLEPLELQIAKSRAYAAQLHRLAERLFNAWFVSQERPLPETPQVTWTECALDEIATFKNGIAMQKYPPDSDEDSLPVIKIAQLRDGHTEAADRVSTQVPAGVLIEDGDAIFSWSGTLMVKLWTGGSAALNQHLFKVTSEQYPRWLPYFWTRAHLPEFQNIAADKKTTMGHIKRHHLTDARVRVPDSDAIAHLDTILAPMVERYLVCELQAKRLEDLRDHVVRALMSGAVQVSGAKALVGATQ